jgi:hypothetical protein
VSNDPSPHPQSVAPARLPAPEPPAAAVRPRNRRNYCLPARYREDADDGEFIDTGNISEESSDNEATPNNAHAQPSSPALSPAHAMPAAQTVPNPAHTTINADPLASTMTPNTTGTNPLEMGGRSKALLTSADVHHFFKKSKQEDMVCKPCQ